MSNIPESTNATPAGQEVERLAAALRIAKHNASHVHGIAWHNLEEISRHELVLSALASLATPSVATPADDAGVRPSAREILASIFDDEDMPATAQMLREGGDMRFSGTRYVLAAIERALAASPKAPSVAIGAREVACPKCGGKWCSVDLCLPKTPSKAGGPSAALERESWTGNPHGLASELRRVANLWREGFRLPQLLRDAADEIDCLAPGSTPASASIPADVELEALQQIDGAAPAHEPSSTPTVGFPPSRDPDVYDGNDVVADAFHEGVLRGRWEAAQPARAALFADGEMA